MHEAAICYYARWLSFTERTRLQYVINANILLPVQIPLVKITI